MALSNNDSPVSMAFCSSAQATSPSYNSITSWALITSVPPFVRFVHFVAKPFLKLL